MDTDVTPVNADIDGGLLTWLVPPFPNWPCAFAPQHVNPPPLMIAHVWFAASLVTIAMYWPLGDALGLVVTLLEAEQELVRDEDCEGEGDRDMPGGELVGDKTTREGDTDMDADPVTLPDTLTAADGVADSDTESEGDGDADTVMEGVGEKVAVWEGVKDTVLVSDSDPVSDGVGDGVGVALEEGEGEASTDGAVSTRALPPLPHSPSPL